MRSLVVVESMFGNTRAVAEAIAESLATAGPATVLDVNEAPESPDGTVDLLIVGGPTHAFGLSRPNSRRAARDQGAKAAERMGLREWLAGLPASPASVPTVAFSTRLKKGFLPGSAATDAARRLRRLGYQQAAVPEDFWVADTAGPLRDGELDRARAWGRGLAQMLGRSPAASMPNKATSLPDKKEEGSRDGR